jgi:hypothetical protein
MFGTIYVIPQLDLLCDISFTPTTFAKIWLLFLRAALKG